MRMISVERGRAGCRLCGHNWLAQCYSETAERLQCPRCLEIAGAMLDVHETGEIPEESEGKCADA